uniref:Uncharacterized protein n=1 Tax=Cucumis melo TaxID=3656 RepID=A0A9I9DDU5_CUCME
ALKNARVQEKDEENNSLPPLPLKRKNASTSKEEVDAAMEEASENDPPHRKRSKLTSKQVIKEETPSSSKSISLQDLPPSPKSDPHTLLENQENLSPSPNDETISPPLHQNHPYHQNCLSPQPAKPSLSYNHQNHSPSSFPRNILLDFPTSS